MYSLRLVAADGSKRCKKSKWQPTLPNVHSKYVISVEIIIQRCRLAIKQKPFSLIYFSRRLESHTDLTTEHYITAVYANVINSPNTVKNFF